MNQAQSPLTPVFQARSGQCSPLPWRVVERRGVTAIVDANDNVVIHNCEIEEKNVNLSQTNAEFICKTVNAIKSILKD